MALMARKEIQTSDDRSSAQKFLEDYDVLTRDNMVLRDENTTLKTENRSLLAEVSMLREELGRSDRRFIQLQGFAVNLTTRLGVIKETIDVAMNESATQKLDATTVTTVEARDHVIKETAEVREIISRLPANSKLPENKF